MDMKQAAEKIGVSVATVKKLIEKGELKAGCYYSGKSVRYFFNDAYINAFALQYSRKKVGRPKAKLANANPAQQSKAFEIFSEGGDWRQVVIQCHIGIPAALDLWRKFNLAPEQVEQIEKLRSREAEFSAQKKARERAERAAEYRRHQERMAELRGKPSVLALVPAPKALPDYSPGGLTVASNQELHEEHTTDLPLTGPSR